MLQARDEGVVLELAHVLLLLLLGSGLILDNNLLGLGVAASSHDASDGLMGDFATSTEGHTLGQNTTEATEHTTALLRSLSGL